MRTLSRRIEGVPAERRGVALLLALLLLFVLVAITVQIGVTTSTDARVARNDLTVSTMDLAIESALLNVHETLKSDGESAGGAGAAAPGAGAGAGAAPGGAAPGGAAPGAAGGESQSSDSRRDEWHEPQRTTINDIQLRVVVVDEDSKYNVMNLLAPDEKEATAAYDRVVRILDLCREGSRDFDIDPRTADQMAKTMLEHMQRRKNSKVPRPALLTDDEGLDQGFPLSLEEFAALEPFAEHHFKDFRDRDGRVVHSIGSFLTVWSSPGLAADLPRAGGAGGATAPAAAGTGGRPVGAAGGGAQAGGAQAGGAGTGSRGAGSGGAGAGGSGAGQAGGAGGGQAGGAGAGQAGGAGTGQAGGAAAGTGGSSNSAGYGVNVNTAPAAVLKALFDDRELHPRFFDKVIEYRNLEEEEEEGASEDETKDKDPVLDEYGQEKIVRRIFDSIGELAEVEGFKDLPAELQTKLNQLLTTQSSVFSIYVVARKSTSSQGEADFGLSPSEQRKKEEMSGDSLVRVVRSVVWRRTVDEEVVLTPILRWEVIDYLPYEVLDFPPDDR